MQAAEDAAATSATQQNDNGIAQEGSHSRVAMELPTNEPAARPSAARSRIGRVGRMSIAFRRTMRRTNSVRFPVAKKFLARASITKRTRSPSFDDLSLFRPADVQRVRMLDASQTDWRVRWWLTLNDQRSSGLAGLWTLLLGGVMVASYVLMVVDASHVQCDKHQLHAAQFALEAIIASEWSARLLLVASLSLVPHLRTRRVAQSSVKCERSQQRGDDGLRSYGGLGTRNSPLEMGVASQLFLLGDGAAASPHSAAETHRTQP